MGHVVCGLGGGGGEVCVCGLWRLLGRVTGKLCLMGCAWLRVGRWGGEDGKEGGREGSYEG